MLSFALTAGAATEKASSMAKSCKPAVLMFYYRGLIESWSKRKRGYLWLPAYSENGPSGGICFPWMTKKACREYARMQQSHAVFNDVLDP